MKLRIFVQIYIVVLAVECAAKLFEISLLEVFAKPVLMLLLGYYFYSNSKDLPPLKNVIIAVLIFSWLGDVLLLVDEIYGSIFLFGLLAFLIVHLLYIFYFRRIGAVNRTNKEFKPLIIAGVCLYSATLYFKMYPTLNGLAIPVLIYSIVITLMLITSFHSFDLKGQTFGRMCVAGTILFVISDSLLGINRFYSPFFPAGALMMVTYGIGQLLIVEGALRNLTQLKSQRKTRPEIIKTG